MDRWIGKTAVVTGAGSGLGAAIALALVNEGMNVIGLDIRVESVQELTKQINEKGKLHAMKCDVSKVSEVISTFDSIIKKFGGVDVLVNNAGILKFGTSTDLGKNVVSNDDIQAVININVAGPVFCTREAIRSMVQRMVAGHVIHINSIAGHYVQNVPPLPYNVYSPSKHFISGFTEVIRQEISNNSSRIKVTSISPGYVTTNLYNASGTPTEVLEGFDLSQALVPQDVANALLYILGTPPNVNITELTIRSIGEAF